MVRERAVHFIPDGPVALTFNCEPRVFRTVRFLSLDIVYQLPSAEEAMSKVFRWNFAIVVTFIARRVWTPTAPRVRLLSATGGLLDQPARWFPSYPKCALVVRVTQPHTALFSSLGLLLSLDHTQTSPLKFLSFFSI